MISVAEATSIIQKHVYPFSTIYAPLEDSTGHVLAEKVTADRDFPPFDRVMMDGIAVAFDAANSSNGVLAISGLIAAGTKKKTLNPTEACEIMTGAVLPEGLDTVIPYEEVQIEEGKGNKVAKIDISNINRGQNIHPQASDVIKGDVIIQPGTLISPAEVAILATVGKSTVKIVKPLHVAIISTGDELVDVSQTPEPHQIRKSNSYALLSTLKQMGCYANQFHINDDKTVIKERIAKLLIDYDVIILSGGVSKGKKDYIPEVLEELNVGKLFHRVKQRPGKPFWFGKSENGTLVFAFPGNPVSTFLCFQKYFKPWFNKCCGLEVPKQFARLTVDFKFKPQLTYFLSVQVVNQQGIISAEPLPGGGSGDLANLTRVDGFLELPEDKGHFVAGEVYHFVPFR